LIVLGVALAPGVHHQREKAMRVYISVDMEGVAGVVHEDQTDPTEPRHAGEYNRMRRLMTSEANEYVDDDYREVFRTWRALHNLAGSS
jgi:hypothetical protein